MQSFVFDLRQLRKDQHALAGGKAANLGELSQLPGIPVPAGICISTAAFTTIVHANPAVPALLDQLSTLATCDVEDIREVSARIRSTIETQAIPTAMQAEIETHLSRLGAAHAYAVRSSATAEDLPTASFAGQQDTYLNVTGTTAILQHIAKCWASLFTERAVLYRMQQGFDHRSVQLAVVVQQMVLPQAAGILFTADPISGNRKVTAIDAGFGLGEALVAGLVNADQYQVQGNQVTHKKIAVKKLAILPKEKGGTQTQELPAAQQLQPVLTDAQILQLAQMGKQIATHFGQPQDIEWCLAEDTFYIVQSRPITTLFPVPEADDTDNHVYLSVGHQQMMTAAMKPLGISFWQLVAARPMQTAAGRLFVDVTAQLSTATARRQLFDIIGKSDPLTIDALQTILARNNFIKFAGGDDQRAPAAAPLPDTFTARIENDPAIVTALIARNEASVAALQDSIRTIAGLALFDFILEDIQELKRVMFDPQGTAVFMTAIEASAWLNEKVAAWLGEKNVADKLSQSVPHNITSEMGLDLLEVADTIRPHAAVVAYLEHTQDENFLSALPALEGGLAAQQAISAYLGKYGMRCTGEIDITKTRWSERPLTLLPIILGNIKNFAPGAARRQFEQALQEAMDKEQDILQRLQQLPGGAQKASEVKRVIRLIRNFIGYREYPKYCKVCRYGIYKQALLREIQQLVEGGVLAAAEDSYYLYFEELREVVRSRQADHALIQQRKTAFRLFEKLSPPRVLTSDGERLSGRYKRDHLPGNALVGLPVSAGMVEGRARVVLHLEDAILEAGDILVTTFTDPSWTPLFVSIKGLVTEVGGLMTHGAVIAREYGLPAVVSVENATRLIRDGQRIRVHGTEGYVELL